jgi:putative transposase
MPRKLRGPTEGLYHVAARAAEGETLFRDEHDFLRFETELERVLSPAFTCVGACALNTHYHLILDTEDGALPKAMHRLNVRYAAAFNARYKRRGHAFADRYLSVPIESEEQFMTVYRYVMRNPVEAGLCDEPADWLWSSYRAALGLPGRFAFADPSMILACFDSVEQMRAFVETPWESDRTAGSDPLRGLTPKSTAGSDPRRGSDPVTEGARPPAARQSSRRA